MRKFSLMLLILWAAACQPAPNELPDVPTQMLLPSQTATDTPTPTATNTSPPSITSTASSTPTPTHTPTTTDTPTITPTASVTVDLTRAAFSTGTAAVIEAPVYSTLTPLPPGVTPRPNITPQMIADVIITEMQFQEEINLRFANNPQITLAEVDFVPGGILINLTAAAGSSAFTTANLLIEVNVSSGVAAFRGGLQLAEGQPEPSDAFIAFATSEFFLEIIDIFDQILKRRLNATPNLENIVITDQSMAITLLVPLR